MQGIRKKKTETVAKGRHGGIAASAEKGVSRQSHSSGAGILKFLAWECYTLK